jgi:hypothetical protein
MKYQSFWCTEHCKKRGPDLVRVLRNDRGTLDFNRFAHYTGGWLALSEHAYLDPQKPGAPPFRVCFLKGWVVLRFGFSLANLSLGLVRHHRPALHDTPLSSNTAVVVRVRADPKPDDDRTIEDTQSAVAESDANGIDVFRLFYFLEAKAGVTRISAEKPVGLPRLSLNFLRQGSQCGSEGARGGWPRLNSEKRLWVAHPCGFVSCKGGAGFR